MVRDDLWSTSARRPDSEACLCLHIQVEFETLISIDIFILGNKYFWNTGLENLYERLISINYHHLYFSVLKSVVSIYNVICVFYHQPQHSAQWSCVRTTRVWPLTSALWGLSPPTTSPFNSGHLSRILLWVNLTFPMEKIHSFAPHFN